MGGTDLVGLLAIGLVAFAAANFDDIIILTIFFSSPKHETSHIVLGQYLGYGIIVALSLVLSLLAFVVPPQLIGLFGIVPILIGIKKLADLRRSKGSSREESEAGRLKGSLKVLEVAGVTFSDGSDDFGVFVPLFAIHGSTSEILVLVIAFLGMTGVYLVLGHYIARRSVLAERIRRTGHLIFPLVLIGIGVFVLVTAVIG